MINIDIPDKCIPVFKDKMRYKVLRGGRGSAKSWTFARYLIFKTAECNKRVLCTREMQNSIKDSVYRLLIDVIVDLKLQDKYDIQKDIIKSYSGSEFIFKGLRHNIAEIKSTEGIDICWVEEAEKVSSDSWDILIPTIRKEDSEILISFNPEDENSATYTKFVKNRPPDCIDIELNYEDNPWFGDTLRKEMEYCKRVDYERYEHVWLGKPKKYGQTVIFKNTVVAEFDEPGEDTQFFYGADFGFSSDPTCLVRMFIRDNRLYIINEAYGHGVEIAELNAFFRAVPGTERWKIIADSERPDTISHLRNQGLIIEGAEKGKGSVEDGIQFLKSFEQIIIHPRCTGSIGDFQNYRWKKDKITDEILPIPIDKSNHACDAARYALEPYIKNKVSCWDVI